MKTICPLSQMNFEIEQEHCLLLHGRRRKEREVFDMQTKSKGGSVNSDVKSKKNIKNDINNNVTS